MRFFLIHKPKFKLLQAVVRFFTRGSCGWFHPLLQSIKAKPKVFRAEFDLELHSADPALESWCPKLCQVFLCSLMFLLNMLAFFFSLQLSQALCGNLAPTLECQNSLLPLLQWLYLKLLAA